MYLTQAYTFKGIALPVTTLKITGITLNPDSTERTLTINRYTDDTFQYDIEQFTVTIDVGVTESEEYYTNLLELPEFSGASIVTPA